MQKMDSSRSSCLRKAATSQRSGPQVEHSGGCACHLGFHQVQRNFSDEYRKPYMDSTIADDISNVGRGQSEAEARIDHGRNFANVLRRARSQNLKLDKANMRLHMNELKYIGHVLSPGGVKADPDKVSHIKNMPTPTDGEQVRRLLGFTNYLAKFLPDLSAISEPLRRIIQKDLEFEWGSAQQQVFDRIEEVATTERSLAYYEVNKPVVVQCDATTLGPGATFMQDGRPVTYASRSLAQCEQNYAPIELECLAIVFSCRKFDQFIYGHPSVIIHSPPTWVNFQ